MTQKQLNAFDGLSLNDNEPMKHPIRGHVKITDKETKEVIAEKDNLVLMYTRAWLFCQLFKVNPPADYKQKMQSSDQICLLTVGQGGADINASAFSPFVPKFSDIDLGQKVPFKVVNPDKNNDTSLAPNPSIVEELTEAQKKIYYMPVNQPDGTTYYFAKRPTGATDDKPYGNSHGLDIDQNSGTISFSMTFDIDKDECRGYLINELGLWMGTFNKNTNSYENLHLATRLTFDTEPMSSLSKSLEIEYTMYI